MSEENCRGWLRKRRARAEQLEPTRGVASCGRRGRRARAGGASGVVGWPRKRAGRRRQGCCVNCPPLSPLQPRVRGRRLTLRGGSPRRAARRGPAASAGRRLNRVRADACAGSTSDGEPRNGRQRGGPVGNRQRGCVQWAGGDRAARIEPGAVGGRRAGARPRVSMLPPAPARLGREHGRPGRELGRVGMADAQKEVGRCGKGG